MTENTAEPSPLIRFSNSVLRRYVAPGLLPVRQANTIVLLLTEFMTETVDPEFLKYASRFLTPEYYDDIVSERNVLHTCGYPICPLKPTKKVFGKDSPQIEYTTESKGISPTSPSSYLRKYCTKRHFQASMIYRAQLSSEAIWARPDIAYLRNGDGEWEKSIALLEEILEAKAKKRDEVTDSEIGDAVMSLEQLRLRTNTKDQQISGSNPDNDDDDDDQNPQQKPESMREKIEKAKQARIKDATIDLSVAERDPNEAKAFAKPPEIPEVPAYEGYVLGSAATIKEPRSYTLWKEKKEQEKLEEELERGVED
ncbi:hypothetical protein BZA70DRAFT_278709 [Myxozyma melibiosi]|uniref:RNA polymerase II subunit B1 CTD phosphatase RPAP2 homolog n=1 Tax=Myxozyma melibiosi TaxID=54550 RepID=A0ABR1F510_9ASCO